MNKYIVMFFVLLLPVFFSGSTFAQGANKNCELTVKRAAFPIYPIAAVATGISGEVAVEIEINKNGEIVRTKMLTGHKLLQNAVEKTFSSWRFSAVPENKKQIFTFTFSIIPQELSNAGITGTFEFPNKITIFALALKDSENIPLLPNVKKKN